MPAGQLVNIEFALLLQLLVAPILLALVADDVGDARRFSGAGYPQFWAKYAEQFDQRDAARRLRQHRPGHVIVLVI